MQPQYKIYFTTKICESSKEQKKPKTEYICIKMVVLQLSDKWINSPKNAKRNLECLISQLTACYCVTTNADCTLAHLFTCENYSLCHEAESLLLKLNVQTYTKKTRRIIKPLCFTRRNVTVLCTLNPGFGKHWLSSKEEIIYSPRFRQTRLLHRHACSTAEDFFVNQRKKKKVCMSNIMMDAHNDLHTNL